MNLVYRITWLVCRLIYATYFRWRVFHPERVPRTGPVILRPGSPAKNLSPRCLSHLPGACAEVR